jgi:tetratricopeptide (TPR) repeat protein
MITAARRCSFVLTALVAVASLSSVACSSTTTNAAHETNADVMRRESSPARLEATGDAAARMGDLTRAEQYYVAALKMGGGRERVITEKLVAVCAADERYPAAIQYAGDFLAAHPQDAEIRFASATLSSAIGDTAAARAGLERVVADRPNMAEAHYALASILPGDAAAPHYRAYLELQPRGRYAESARAAIGGEL